MRATTLSFRGCYAPQRWSRYGLAVLEGLALLLDVLLGLGQAIPSVERTKDRVRPKYRGARESMSGSLGMIRSR